ncbi:MAG: GNAT family N-acetyltransferase [Acidimicrobiia bacterium]
MATVISQHPRFTPRLVLRPFRKRDVGAVHEAILASLPDLAQWLPWAASNYSRPVTTQFLRDSVTAWGDEKAYDFAIRSREDPDRHLGNASVWWTSKANLAGEIGYWIRSDATGSGVCTEAVARLLQVGFEELGMHRASLRIAVGNVASERVAEKLGFLREGLLRDEVKVGAVWLDHTAWGLLDREWQVERLRYEAEAWV